MLTYLTCGESHGKYLTAILEGLPSGLTLDVAAIDAELKRRQQGYGRGGRMSIEADYVTITGGVVRGKTTGAPLGLMLVNNDYKIDSLLQLERPRPGHADLAGALKYDQGIREVLERASARETAMRVAVGAVCKQLLDAFAIEIAGHVIQIGPVHLPSRTYTVREIRSRISRSKLNCVSPQAERAMIRTIDRARMHGDTVGGAIEVVATGVPLGLGSYVHHARKLDAALAAALMSIQAVKAVEVGLGTACGEQFGSRVHDAIFYKRGRGYYHMTNNAGGIEGGMSNGADIVVRATMKPIATLKKPLRSVNMRTKKSEAANFERSDVCAVPALSVIGEAVTAQVLADAFLTKFGSDSMRELVRNYQSYLRQIGQKESRKS